MVARRTVLGVTALAASAGLLLAVAWPEHQTGGARIVGDDPRILVARDQYVSHGLAGFGFPRLQYYVPGKCFVAGLGRIGEKGPDGNYLLDEPEAAPVIPTPPPNKYAAPWTNVVWPRGTKVVREGERVGVRLSNGSTIWAGERFSGGGGGVSDDQNWKQLDHGMPSICVGRLLFGLDTVEPPRAQPRHEFGASPAES